MAHPGRRSTAVLRLRSVLDHVAVRIGLSLAIVFSLLPLPWVARLDPWFFGLFALELGARAVLALRAERPGVSRMDVASSGWVRPRASDVALLALDLVALLSFLPLAVAQGATTRWLRLFRLTRMLMLLKYWAPLARDLWSVVLRRERLRQVVLMGVVVLVLSFAGAVILDHATDRLRVDFDGDGEIRPHGTDGSFWVRLWWAFRQIQDPGNMLTTPSELLVLAVSVALTVFGLFLVSFLIGLGTDVVRELMELSRLRPPGLRRHTVVVNITPWTRQLLFELIRHYRKLVPEGTPLLSMAGLAELTRKIARRREFLIVGRAVDPPDFLREPEFAHVVYRRRVPEDDDEAFLARAEIAAARRVLIFGDTEAADPDDETIRLLLTIGERMARSPDDGRDESRHKLIAEVFDESNILAATTAIAGARERLEAHVVPTERLLAMFVGAVMRRPGSARLLVELLTSHGHELYTYDWRHRASGSIPAEPPRDLGTPAEALVRLHAAAVARRPAERLVPVGILVERRDGDDREVRAVINPRDGSEVDGELCGFVALAPNFRIVRDFAAEVRARGARIGGGSVEPADCPPLERAPTTDFSRTVICGFRAATVGLVEAIMTTQPDATVLVLVDGPEARAAALDAFDSNARLVESGLLAGRRGTFVPGDHGLRWRSLGAAEPARGIVYVEIGDWTSSRQLMRLPHGIGDVADATAVVLLSDDRPGCDARTTTALMKIEALVARAGRSSQGPQVGCEVLDAELAQRLARRGQGHRDLRRTCVFSIQELRAYFMFQAVVVPHFDLVYGELLGPWGESLCELRPVAPASAASTFTELAARLRAEGRLLVGIEHAEGAMTVGEGVAPGDRVDLSRVAGLWVVDADRADPGSDGRDSPVGTT